MKWLERWAWDLIPATFVAVILLYLIAGLAKPDETCPPMYKMQVSMEKQDNVLVCKYRP